MIYDISRFYNIRTPLDTCRTPGSQERSPATDNVKPVMFNLVYLVDWFSMPETKQTTNEIDYVTPGRERSPGPPPPPPRPSPPPHPRPPPPF